MPYEPQIFYKSLTTAVCENIDPDLVKDEDDLRPAKLITLVDVMF
jgi:hypothetical protein